MKITFNAFTNHLDRSRLRKTRCTFDEQMAIRFPRVFYRVEITEQIYRGALAAAQSYGVGGFAANSVMLGWPTKPGRQIPFIELLEDLIALDRSIMLVRYDDERALGEIGRASCRERV